MARASGHGHAVYLPRDFVCGNGFHFSTVATATVTCRARTRCHSRTGFTL
ncbi:hypothetical protein HMPREF0298_0334 [Corynebacterium lipophiloflavum DSM 44291]|uniref:Uncharacterized protein n=1 Tax=Corynebacterium lipophiloflavum (strain ATCC 700352 / DSM 44291 / CCUG 37336 / JCM 10383 / DMMZ 1944) TaxID=525263 RepID=C0XPF6_CORLD|nr:hypothetical protein HMPREF0298_0334 [Corynebacterium lipophiloflavum DSM 44291]